MRPSFTGLLSFFTAGKTASGIVIEPAPAESIAVNLRRFIFMLNVFIILDLVPAN